ncbi:hypothetical protein [Enterococcus mundtii]|uniref:hypothetical protein n=1 Tax=Enterococcus mundtii TaxID=53346 RepID=UPI0023045EA3|nr:hypothetical protein [Enterococcus mundtii]
MKNSEEEKVEIAKQQYEALHLKGEIFINTNKEFNGYVSHINSKITDEQSFIDRICVHRNKYSLKKTLKRRDNIKT